MKFKTQPIIILRAVALGLALGTPAFANSVEQAVINQLAAQGYTKIQVQKTLLGRTRFVATMGAGRREVIINTHTGEVLRDYTSATGGKATAPTLSRSGSGNRGSSSSRDDDDDDDDDRDDDNSGSGNSRDDDDDDDDNSGSDSSRDDDDDDNSGSGSSRDDDDDDDGGGRGRGRGRGGDDDSDDDDDD